MTLHTWDAFIDKLVAEPQNTMMGRDTLLEKIHDAEKFPWPVKYVVDHPLRTQEYQVPCSKEQVESLSYKGPVYVSRNACLAYFQDEEDSIMFELAFGSI